MREYRTTNNKWSMGYSEDEKGEGYGLTYAAPSEWSPAGQERMNMRLNKIISRPTMMKGIVPGFQKSINDGHLMF